jgi:hypothetical protein
MSHLGRRVPHKLIRPRKLSSIRKVSKAKKITNTPPNPKSDVKNATGKPKKARKSGHLLQSNAALLVGLFFALLDVKVLDL